MTAFALVLVIIGAVLLILASPRKGRAVHIAKGEIKTTLPEVTGWAKIPLFVLGLACIGLGIWMGVLVFIRVYEVPISPPTISAPTNTTSPTETPVPPTLTSTPVLGTTSIITPTMSPSPSSISYQNFEENNGTFPGLGNYFWGAAYMTCSWEPGPKNPAIVFEGERAVRCETQTKAQVPKKNINGGAVGINPARDRNDPVDISQATIISVWIYDTTRGGNNAELKLRDNKDNISNGVYSSSKTLTVQNSWIEITWTLSGFENIDLRHIKNIEVYLYNDGVYYFDAVAYR